MRMLHIVLVCVGLFAVPVRAEDEAQRRELAALAQRISKDVERLRGWRFEGPVRTGFVQRDDLAAKFERDIDEEYPEAQLRADEAFLKIIGALPSAIDAKAELLELLSAQIGGYYDPKDKTFYIVADVARRYGPLPLAVVIAHELTHALDDQRLDLKGLLDSAEKEEDRSFAVAAVVEGSATVLMNRYLVAELEKTGSATLGLVLFSAVSLLQDREAMERLVRSPRYFHTMIARYTAGETFLRYGALTIDGETEEARHAAALLRAAQDLPRSSEQILHPAKYWQADARDEPVEVHDESFHRLLRQAGLRSTHEQTAGELLCAIVTQEAGNFALTSWTNPAATGWGGDRFYLIEPEADHAAPAGDAASRPLTRGVWLTLWDTLEDRDEFLHAYRREADTILLGDRGAVLLFNIDQERRAKLAAALERTPPKLVRSGEPWPLTVDR